MRIALMTDEEYAWVLSVKLRYGALAFLWIGRFGSNWMMLPGYIWKPRWVSA